MDSALHQHYTSGGRRSIPASTGIGLRPPHHAWVIERRPPVSWFEVHAENFMTHGLLVGELDSIALKYPLSLHCVGLSLGSVARPEKAHLHRLRELVTRCNPDLISDHLAWNAVDGMHLPDLLPLPYTEEALEVVIRNVHHVQDFLRRQILLENPSTYTYIAHSTLSEAEFLAEVALQTGCGVLLDVNNVYVSARNQNSDPNRALVHFLDTVSAQSIGEIHLAGHTIAEGDGTRELLVDDHGSRVSPDVWGLYGEAVATLGPVPTLIEWDNRIPIFSVLEEEASIADSLMSARALGETSRVVAA
jgi:uncharacterized protein